MLTKINQQVVYSKKLVKNIKFSSQKLSIKDSKIKNFKSKNQDYKLAIT